jgi:hypothetical protein
MGRIALLVIILLSSACLMAQETPKVEVFGGYSLARINDQAVTEEEIIQNGWNAAVAVNIHKYLGVVSDFGGYYGTHRLPPFVALTCPTCPMTTPNPFQESTQFHTFMFGPQGSVRLQKFTPFAHALFGVAHEHGDLVPTAPFGSVSGTGFAFALGGGLDTSLSHRFSFRVQADYMHFSSLFQFQPGQNNLRFSTGLVFRFGK